ncbi:MAG: HAD family hydrolase [Nitrososphaerales archaeon]
MSDYSKIMDKAWVNQNSISKFKDLECVIFDCDGTLVDINKSYNACIKHSVGFILERMIGGKQWYNLVTDEIIMKFRMSGGFNNDTDTTYASILSAIASKTHDMEQVRKFVSNVATQADERGLESVEEYLSEVGFTKVVKRVKGELGHAGIGSSSLPGKVFDEFFYGKELFVKIYGKEPVFNYSEGFLEKDKVLISSESACQISHMFNGNIAIVSGRSRFATEYTLKSILQYFNLDASVFIEDEEKKVKNNRSQVKKPSPYSLLKSIKAFDVKNALCAGDSVEDIIMARKASENQNIKTVICGVYGSVADRDLQFKVFMNRNVDAILENVNILPSFLTMFED